MIYKYRKWNQFTHNGIVNGDIYFSRLFDLNDPFEGDFRLSAKALIVSMAKNMKRSGDKREIREIINGLEALNAAQKINLDEKIRIDRNLIKKSSYIFSASKIFDDIVMWTHYAENHKGICIGYDDKIIDIKMPDGINIVHDDNESVFTTVQYKNDSLILKQDSNGNFKVDEILRQKSTQWSYEEEVRIIAASSRTTKSGFSAKIDRASIKEVMIGANASEEFVEEIVHICQLVNISVFRMAINHGEFKLMKFRLW